MRTELIKPSTGETESCWISDYDRKTGETIFGVIHEDLRGRLWIPIYLYWLGETGNPGKAALRAGVDTSTPRQLKRLSPDFKALCDSAEEYGLDRVEEALRMEAIEGQFEPSLYKGKPVVHDGQIVGKTKKSVTAAIQLLKMKRYHNRSHGTTENPVVHKHDHQVTLSSEELDKVVERTVVARLEAKKAEDTEIIDAEIIG